MTLTPELVLGICGTVTGTVSLFISWKQWYADRHLLRLEAHISICKSVQIPQSHLSLKLTLKNYGRRPVRITDVGILMAENERQVQNGQNVFLQSSRLRPSEFQFDVMVLGEGERQDLVVRPFNVEILASARKRVSRFLTLYAIDSLDNEYRVKTRIPDEKDLEEITKTAPDA